LSLVDEIKLINYSML